MRTLGKRNLPEASMVPSTNRCTREADKAPPGECVRATWYQRLGMNWKLRGSSRALDCRTRSTSTPPAHARSLQEAAATAGCLRSEGTGWLLSIVTAHACRSQEATAMICLSHCAETQSGHRRVLSESLIPHIRAHQTAGCLRSEGTGWLLSIVSVISSSWTPSPSRSQLGPSYVCL